QIDSTTSGAQTRHQQETTPSTPPAVTFKTLVNFDGTNGTNGADLIQSPDGNLYGTSGGGANGSGLLFKMTPAGKLTPVYNFCSETECADGNGPGDLVLGTDGSFHGGTLYGGAFGYGTLFKITEKGILTTLYNFDGADGRSFKYLVQASGGNFYGTTTNGGNVTQCDGFGCGTVFKITPSGTLTPLYDFCSQTGCPDGAILFDSLVQGPNGEYYGATWGGDLANGGTVFTITPEGTLATLYSFCVVNYPFCNDGSNPIALVLGGDGNFYGATAAGGINSNAGTVFKNHSRRDVYQDLQLLRPGRVYGRLHPSRWNDPGQRRKPLRDNLLWRTQRRRHSLSDNTRRCANNTAQLRWYGWELSHRLAVSSDQWHFLRDN